MNPEFEQQFELLMETAIDDALEQHRKANPDYDALCVREDDLFQALHRFFSGGNRQDAPLYFDIMREYFNLMNTKPHSEMELTYMRGVLDCICIAQKLGWMGGGAVGEATEGSDRTKTGGGL